MLKRFVCATALLVFWTSLAAAYEGSFYQKQADSWRKTVLSLTFSQAKCERLAPKLVAPCHTLYQRLTGVVSGLIDNYLAWDKALDEKRKDDAFVSKVRDTELLVEYRKLVRRLWQTHYLFGTAGWNTRLPSALYYDSYLEERGATRAMLVKCTVPPFPALFPDCTKDWQAYDQALERLLTKSLELNEVRAQGKDLSAYLDRYVEEAEFRKAAVEVEISTKRKYFNN